MPLDLTPVEDQITSIKERSTNMFNILKQYFSEDSGPMYVKIQTGPFTSLTKRIKKFKDLIVIDKEFNKLFTKSTQDYVLPVGLINDKVGGNDIEYIITTLKHQRPAVTGDSTAEGFYGCVYDGRFVYMAPFYNGVVGIYDTITNDIEHIDIKDESSSTYINAILMGDEIAFIKNTDSNKVVTFLNITTKAITHYDYSLDNSSDKYLINGIYFNGNKCFWNRSISRVIIDRPGSLSTLRVDLKEGNSNVSNITNAIYDGSDHVYFLPLASGNVIVKMNVLDNSLTYITVVKGGPVTYDGRYIYISQYGLGILKLDTTDDTSVLIPLAISASGNGCFDGRYVYFPRNDINNIILDTETNEIFLIPLNGGNTNGKGYTSCVYTGKRVLFIPHQIGGTPNRVMVSIIPFNDIINNKDL